MRRDTLTRATRIDLRAKRSSAASKSQSESDRTLLVSCRSSSICSRMEGVIRDLTSSERFSLRMGIKAGRGRETSPAGKEPAPQEEGWGTLAGRLNYGGSMRLIVLSVLLLSACANQPNLWRATTPEERAQMDQREQAERDKARNAYLDSLRAQCSAYGFQVGTQEMASCMMRTHELNVQARAAQRQSDVAAGSAMLGYGASMSAQGARQFAPNPGFTCFQNGPMLTCR